MKSQENQDYLSVKSKVAEIQLTYKHPVSFAQRPRIQSSKDAFEIFESLWSDQIGLIEEFNILLLDRSNRVLARHLVSKGGISSTVVDPKIVFSVALCARASSIILAHNHPSGNLQPSQMDKDLTTKLVNAGKLLDLPILDHLILTPESTYYSFADESLI